MAVGARSGNVPGWAQSVRPLTDKGKKVGMGKAVVAVARKLAIVMHKIWLTGEPFRFGKAEAAPMTC